MKTNELINIIINNTGLKNNKNIEKLKSILNKFIKYNLDLSWGLIVLRIYSINSVACYRLLEMVFNGLVQKIDVSWFLHSNFDFEQRAAIYFGLLANVDVSIYANLLFDAGQMRIIREGLKHNIDVSIFADPKISANKMLEEFAKIINLKNKY